MILQKTLNFLKKKEIKHNRNNELGLYTTIKIGGKPALSIIPETREQLEELLIHLIREGLPYIIIGGGSNIAFQDSPSNIIAVINRAGQIDECDKTTLYVDSGACNSSIIARTIKEGLGGLEFLSGIPGTIGGAAAVHAGAFGKSISEVILSADIINAEGKTETIKPEDFRFQYRNSRFKYSTSEVILGLTLKVSRSDTETVKEKSRNYIDYRKTNHPPAKVFSAGCFFKNPVVEGKKGSAGKAIEISGLKGFCIDNLEISQIHANFLINRGGASFSELESFTNRVSSIVKEKEGIELEREIIFIDNNGKKY